METNTHSPVVELYQFPDYIPLQEFLEETLAGMPRPYPHRLSFRPLINHLKENHCLDEASPLVSLLKKLEGIEQEIEGKEEVTSFLKSHGDFQSLISFLFPAFFLQNQLGFLAVPGTGDLFYFTDELKKEMMSGQWEMKMASFDRQREALPIEVDSGTRILQRHYGQERPEFPYEVMTLRDTKTHLEKHFKINFLWDHVEVKATQSLKKLSATQIYDLYTDWSNTTQWLELLSPDRFQFEGLTLGYLTDVTPDAIVSNIQRMIVAPPDQKPEDPLAYLNTQIRSYLAMPDLQFGSFQSSDPTMFEHISWSLIGPPEVLSSLDRSDFHTGCYGQVLKHNEIQIVADLTTMEDPPKIESLYMEKGFRSLFFAPLHNSEGRLIGVFELASPQPHQFTRLTAHLLSEIIKLFAMGTDRWLQEIHNQVNFLMQKQFTSIHPSVSWKFTEVARKFMWEKEFKGENSELDPVVFPNVYPLYGQADIVGSSRQRNESIRRDMLDNLQRVTTLMELAREQIYFHLLDLYLGKTRKLIDRLEGEKFNSNDESLIVELLTREIHPLLHQLYREYPQLEQDPYHEYVAYLDVKLDIVYRFRKSYEDSVAQLNYAIATHLEEGDQEMQQVLPHFFERYKTDGVEFNMYLGQSLLENGQFSEFMLKDFRLWQLIMMCEITRLVAEKGPQLPVPLTTAQLIFVYNAPLSIRFRLDEKQFDVDGAYNIRYEILKKRIDKAVVKGTGERLTQSGKVAIVWLQEKDRQEYREYLVHLIDRGYIHPAIEELELEQTQGVDGLKALRVEVIQP